jgi:membrane associated rhomboid family serine protease
VTVDVHARRPAAYRRHLLFFWNFVYPLCGLAAEALQIGSISDIAQAGAAYFAHICGFTGDLLFIEPFGARRSQDLPKIYVE